MSALNVDEAWQPESSPEDTENQQQLAKRPRQQPGSACEECRRRKVRCDRQRPQCGLCLESKMTCKMPTTTPPRGPKKGHVRNLMNQIATLEQKLDAQERELASSRLMDLTTDSSDATSDSRTRSGSFQVPDFGDNFWTKPMLMHDTTVMSPIATSVTTPLPTPQTSSTPLAFPPLTPLASSFGTSDPLAVTMSSHITLSHLESPAHEEVCLSDMARLDLDQLYWDRVHAFAPMLNRSRCLSLSRDAAKSKGWACLRTAMWAMAAQLSSQFHHVRDALYLEARRLLVASDMDPNGVGIQLEHVQAWLLLSFYEFMRTDYRRGMCSLGRVFRLVQLLHLHELDGNSCPASSRADVAETESGRRTFWIAYIADRLTCLRDGLPLTLMEEDIRTHLPVSDQHFQGGQRMNTVFLSDVMANVAMGSPSSLVECIIITTICGRILTHKRRCASHEPIFGSASSHQELLQRREWLRSSLAMSNKALLTQRPSASEIPDPTSMLSALTAHINVLALCKIIETNHLDHTEDAHALVNDSRLLSQAVLNKVGVLTKTASHLSQFQTHPLLPIPLQSCAKYMSSSVAAKASEDGTYTAEIQAVKDALHTMKDVNNLAQDALNDLGSLASMELDLAHSASML